jgi:4-hydroxyproline epimerase
MPHPIDFIDSHTAGEPTRLIIAGGPDLGDGPLDERLALLRNQHDALRRTVINEPRGSDVLVGALLCTPHDPSASAGVIFFNNVGYLGMCGHGTIGLVASLAYIGRIGVGAHRIETPVGTITAQLHPDGSVTVANVASYRHAQHVAITLPDGRTIHGDVAWGGNWFFLCHDHGYDLHHDTIATLTQAANTIRHALVAHGITGRDNAEIDHIELFGPAAPGADSRSFVLCPGEAYDRSPCGTGTSAKLACLAADGLLAPDHEWIQESIIGSRFQARYQRDANGQIWPLITGRAYVTMVGQIITDPADPFGNGIQR